MLLPLKYGNESRNLKEEVEFKIKNCVKLVHFAIC